MPTIDQIAAALQGYDPQALSADHVNRFLDRLISPVSETECVGVFQALGRVLADDVISPISVPPHDNSAMDGFAFDGGQLLAGQIPVSATAPINWCNFPDADPNNLTTYSNFGRSAIDFSATARLFSEGRMISLPPDRPLPT